MVGTNQEKKKFWKLGVGEGVEGPVHISRVAKKKRERRVEKKERGGEKGGGGGGGGWINILGLSKENMMSSRCDISSEAYLYEASLVVAHGYLRHVTHKIVQPIVQSSQDIDWTVHVSETVT